MPLVQTKTILTHAMEHRYGVAAFNTFNFETINWAIKTAEQERIPVIIQYYPGYKDYLSVKLFAAIAKELAEKATVPVAVHLDHSASFDIAVSGIRDGCPSVMIDGSRLDYEANVSLTAAVTRTARVFGIDVEAELGRVGSGSSLDDITNRDLYTDVDSAVDFVERTGCDALAVAVGNAHGAYVKQPELDFGRIRAIRQKVSIPLVLHGCSDIPDEQIKEAVNQGMSKFNIATEYFRAFYHALNADIATSKTNDAYELLKQTEAPVMEFLRAKIRLLNPNHFSL